MCVCAYEVIAGAIEVQFVCAMLAGVCVFQALVCSSWSLVQCTNYATCIPQFEIVLETKPTLQS